MEHKKNYWLYFASSGCLLLAIIVAGIYTLIYDCLFRESPARVAEVCISFAAGVALIPLAFRASALHGGKQPAMVALPISTLHPQPQRHASDRQAHEGKDYDEWDVFISHASENRDAIARPLAEALRPKGCGCGMTNSHWQSVTASEVN